MSGMDSELNWENLSDEEWNKRLDDRIATFNEGRGEIAAPPAPHLLLRGEYERGINHKLVTEDLIRHLADAIGDPNPIWRDPAYAAGTRWGGIVAPPLYDTVIAFGSAFADRLRIPGVSRLNGGYKHVYFKPIRPGDTFAIYDKYEGIVEKQVTDKPYRMFVESASRYYVNQRDEVATISISRSIYMGTPPGKRGKNKETKMYQDKQRHYYSDEELEMIHQAYDDQIAGVNRRGANTLYWEDVVEGEAIPTIIKGPVDVCDACARTMVSCYAYAFAIKWAAMREHLQHHPIDPDTGEHMFLRDWHYSDHAAQVRGYPFANSAGAQNEMMLVHPVTDWMGDAGFVKSMDSQARRMLFFGDMTFAKGTVKKKYVENGEHLVLLDVWGENQDGVVHTKADFVVKLVSKSAYDKEI
ncbi:MAG: MaoC family dehydratase N-terminal domain-containing protein [Clostridiales Family XIII bacterium]|nr:MaoC family dehydratase N-terminal domain-containing protein [Clostridiales Family XIII bacterium]